MSEAFQEWIIESLTGDPALAALCGGTVRVHDRVPEARHFPLVVIGAIETAPDGTDDLPGTAQTATIHVWSRSANRRESYRIADRIAALMQAVPAVHGTLRIVTAAVVATLVRRLEAEGAFHAQLRLRAVCEPA